MSMDKLVQGTYAAVITPRDKDGNIAKQSLVRWLKFLLDAGITGFALNGATGEFPLVTETEFQCLMEVAAITIKGRASFLAGIGAGDVRIANRFASIAIAAGASAMLLPMPSFFPYAQDDLMNFAGAVACEVDAPILVYNLPQFTTPVDAKTTLHLVQQYENIIGTKDSSGSLETFRLLRREAPDACCIVGNDRALISALNEGLADGVVSGVACVLPELILQIFENGIKGEFSSVAIEALHEFIQQLDKMPTPWGLKVMAEARGIATASFPFPLGERRRNQFAEMKEWLLQNGAAVCATSTRT